MNSTAHFSVNLYAKNEKQNFRIQKMLIIIITIGCSGSEESVYSVDSRFVDVHATISPTNVSILFTYTQTQSNKQNIKEIKNEMKYLVLWLMAMAYGYAIRANCAWIIM